MRTHPWRRVGPSRYRPGARPKLIVNRRIPSRTRVWIVEGALASVAVVLMVVAGARAFTAVSALERATLVTTSATASSLDLSVDACAAANARRQCTVHVRAGGSGLIYHSVLHLQFHAFGGFRASEGS
jgi:hypothetical protein